MASVLRLLIVAVSLSAGLKAVAQDDVADVPSRKMQAGNDTAKTYFLIGAAKDQKEPDPGYSLLVVLPGGDGSAAFLPFVKRLYKHAAPDGYLVVQLVAPKWTPEQQIVWPHRKNKVPGMKFGMEEFVDAVVTDVRKQLKIKTKHVFTLGWSSSGPAVYATSLRQDKTITGSYVAMSVFNKTYLPPLSYAKGHAYYIEHSPDDKVCPFWMANRARKELTNAGASVHFATTRGGHGWKGDVYGRMRKAIMWLEENVTREIERAAGGDAEHVATLLFSENFDEANLESRQWYDMSRIRIAGDVAAGKGCIEYEWIDKKSKVQGSSGMRRLFRPTNEIYIRFYLRLSSNWGWSGRNYHPHLTHLLTTENSKWHGPAASHLTLYIEPVNGKLRLAAQDIQNKNMPHGLTQGPLRGGYNGKFYDSKEVLFKDDKWHCIEAYFKLNTLDLKNDRPNQDGIVRGWFDGKLVIEHTDVILRSTDFPGMKFNQFLMAPYFGPGLLPHAQKLWIDELMVGLKRIGPLTMKKLPAGD